MSGILDKFFKGIDYLMGIMAGLMIGFVFLNVVLRVVFNSGIVWSEEIARYLFVFIIYIGAIGATRENTHLGMDTVICRLPHRVKRVIYIVSQSLIFILMIMLTHGSCKMTIQNVNATAAATGIPLSYIYGVGMVTGVCIGIISLANIYKAITVPEAVNKMVLLHESEEDDIVEEITTDIPADVKEDKADKGDE
jgi:TRAP-type transport system small permease protein